MVTVTVKTLHVSVCQCHTQTVAILTLNTLQVILFFHKVTSLLCKVLCYYSQLLECSKTINIKKWAKLRML